MNSFMKIERESSYHSLAKINEKQRTISLDQLNFSNSVGDFFISIVEDILALLNWGLLYKFY